jgi:GT2 family glycosyltransferase
MSNSPLVFIIILNWNGKKDTIECLHSLEKVTYPNKKIIVVDNASSDGSVEEIQRLFSEVEVIVNDTNLRFAGGNNVGIKRAIEQGAEYILLLNNDTIVEIDFLSRLVEEAQKNEKIGMVGPKIYYYSDPKRLWYAGGKIILWKGLIAHIGVHEIDEGQYDSIKETAYITGCCILVKRSVIETVGLLDESYYIYGEDADWCVRVARAGFKLIYVPSALIWHKLSVASGGHFSWFKNWNKLKSQLRLLWRYAKFYHWLTIPFFMFVNIIQSFLKSKHQ